MRSFCFVHTHDDGEILGRMDQDYDSLEAKMESLEMHGKLTTSPVQTDYLLGDNIPYASCGTQYSVNKESYQEPVWTLKHAQIWFVLGKCNLPAQLLSH